MYKLLKMAVIAAAIAPKSEPLEVQDVESGAKTQVETLSITLASDAAAWEKIWKQHQGPIELNGATNVIGQPAPEIDFKKSMVLAVFAGAQNNIGGFEVEGIDDKGEKAIIRLLPSRLPSPNPILMTPYIFLQLSRTKKPIQLQIQQADGRWKTYGEYQIRAVRKPGT